MSLRNPKHIIIAGIVFFAIASISSLTVRSYRYDNWWQVLPLYGKLATVGIGACIVWVFYVTLFKPKKE